LDPLLTWCWQHAPTPAHLARPVSILDFAPTFCEALGVQHDGFEGSAILEIVESLKSRLPHHLAEA
jgi:arylsulfatase A-like enzyme